MSLGGGCECEETGRVHVVCSDCEFRAVELPDSLDHQDICLKSGDLRPHCVEQLCQLRDMWFARGVSYGRGSLCENCGHEEVFSGGDACLVEEQRSPRESRGASLEVVKPVVGGSCVDSESSQPVEVRVEPPPSDFVSPWLVDMCFAVSGRHWACEEERCAYCVAEFLRRGGVAEPLCAELHGGFVDFAHRDPHFHRDGEHVLDIEDVRDVVQDDGLVGQERGRHHWEGGVLVALDPDGAACALSACDFKCFHLWRLQPP